MKGRRQKSFEERRQELMGAIDQISDSLREFEKTGKVHWLRSIATQLRALIVFRPKSPSLKHPLLFELAKEKRFPLTVFSTDPGYLYKIKSIIGDSLIFYSTVDPFNLEKDEIYNTPLPLEGAMETLSVEMLGQQKSVKCIISYVADTEASHYDPGKPPILDDLSLIELGGLPTHYRIVYALGRIVRDLGYKFLLATTFPQKERQENVSVNPLRIVTNNLVGSGMRVDLGSSFENPNPGTLTFRWRVGKKSLKMMLVDLVGGVTENRISVILDEDGSLLLRAYDSIAYEVSIRSKFHIPDSVLPVAVVWNKRKISFWIQGTLIGREQLSKAFDAPWSLLLCGIDVTGELSADNFRKGYKIDGLTGLNLGRGEVSEGARLSDVGVHCTTLSPRDIKDLATTSDEEVEILIAESHR